MKRRLLFVLTLLLFCSLTLVYAQTGEAPPPVDWKQVATGALMALTGTLTFLILWVLKFAWSKIPATILIYASFVVGPLVNFAIDWLTSHQAGLPWYLAILAGALAPALREFVSTPATKGLTGGISATKGLL